MPSPTLLYSFIDRADRTLSGFQVALHERRGGLVSIFLHGLFHDQAEVSQRLAYPQQDTTIEVFSDFIKYFQNAGYTFISPEDLLTPLQPRGRYGIITFDDGYFNNTRVIPVVEKYKVPVTVFVSVRHVLEQKAYWWESLYRFRRAQGRDMREIADEAFHLNLLRTEVAERRLQDEFGSEFLVPGGDLDRPVTVDELRSFAAHPLVSIGNHTFNHNVLTAYEPGEIRDSIRAAQESLAKIVGKPPVCIAYPNGEVTPEIAQIASEEGLRLGFSTVPRKEYLPQVLDTKRRMVIGRFCPTAASNYRQQYRFFRSDLMLTNRLRSLKRTVGAKHGI
jgi:peptidoglycan/xylan/chitin deacetylase (PgdA/CDA1 family)